MKTFVRIDAWEEMSRTDPHRYVKKLVDGKVLRTRISFGRGAAFDDPALWAHVWRRQLDLRCEDEFWAALRTGKPVDRTSAQSSPAPAEPTKPLWLVEFLVNVAGLAPGDVLAMTEEDAMAAYLRYVSSRSA